MSDKPFIVSVLGDFATSTAARYGHPVYLVGSAVDTVDLPYEQQCAAVWALRDVDVVCILPDEEFANRFGGSWEAAQSDLAPGRRWAAEVGKISRSAARELSNLNLDFKVQSDGWTRARHQDKRRVRIDAVDFGEEST